MRGPFQVQNIAALATLPADNGSIVYVQTVRALWNFVVGSALTTDAITVVNGLGGQWLRVLPSPDLSWAYQASWFCDPSGGNDENVGSTSGTAIKTLAELDRRLSTQMLQQTTSVSLLGSYAAQYFRLTDVRIADNPGNAGGNGPFRLIVQGASSAFTTIFTSNVAGIASFQSVTRVAGGVRYAVTDNNLGGTDPATFIGHRIRLTSGANTGATSWVLAKLSATQFATAPFIAAVDPATGDFSASTIITPVGGDQYVIEDVVGLKGIEIINGIGRPDTRDGTGTTSPFSPIIAHVDVGQGGTTLTDQADSNVMISGTVHGLVTVPRPVFAYSKLLALVAGFGGGTVFGSCFPEITSLSIVAGVITGCCALTAGAGVGAQIILSCGAPIGSEIVFANDFTGEGVGISIQGENGISIQDTGVGCYNCVGIPFSINAGQYVNANGIIYGTNPSVTGGGAAMRIQSGSFLRYIGAANKPVITANTPGTNDLQLNQGNFQCGWASVPLALPEVGFVLVDNTNNVGRVYRTAVAAAIGATNLFPGVPDKGLYSIDVYLAVTTIGAGGDTASVTFTWTDDSQAETSTPISVVSVAAKGQFQARIVVETDGLANVTYALSFPTKTGNPQVSIRIAARPLQNAGA